MGATDNAPPQSTLRANGQGGLGPARAWPQLAHWAGPAALSLALHVGVAVWWAAGMDAEALHEPQEIMNVRLVLQAPPAPRPPAVAPLPEPRPAVAPPPPRPAPPPPEPPPPEPPPKAVPPPAPPPPLRQTKEPALALAPEPEPERPVPKLQTRPAEAPPPPKTAPRPEPPPPSPPVEVARAQPPPAPVPSAKAQAAERLARERAEHDYFAQVRGWLERHKRYPRQAMRLRQQGTVLLRFVLDRDGQVISHRIEKSSGVASLDREAEALLERAAPFPTMPDEVGQARVELTVPVSYLLSGA